MRGKKYYDTFYAPPTAFPFSVRILAKTKNLVFIFNGLKIKDTIDNLTQSNIFFHYFLSHKMLSVQVLSRKMCSEDSV